MADSDGVVVDSTSSSSACPSQLALVSLSSSNVYGHQLSSQKKDVMPKSKVVAKAELKTQASKAHLLKFFVGKKP